MGKSKIMQLEGLLNAQDIDVLLVLSREDSDITLPLLLDAHVVAQTAFLFRKNGEHIVLTGKTDANAYEVFECFDIRPIKESFEQELKEIVQIINPTKIALNISENDYLVDGLTVGQYMMLEDIFGADYLDEKVVSSESLLQPLRSIKSVDEIEKIEEAVQITCDIYDAVKEQIKIGMTECEIGELFVKQMREKGVVNAFGEPFSYPLICINRCGLAHREPNPNYILQEGDILIVDFSIRHKGYTSDIARSFYALRNDEEVAPPNVQEAFKTTVNAVSNVLKNMRPSMKGYEVDALGRKVIEAGGYPTIRHATGHQLGMRVHDGGTSLSPYNKNRPSTEGTIKINEVYAIEPTVIQDDGLPSFIVEEDIVVTENGVRVLSRRQHELYYIRD